MGSSQSKTRRITTSPESMLMLIYRENLETTFEKETVRWTSQK